MTSLVREHVAAAPHPIADEDGQVTKASHTWRRRDSEGIAATTVKTDGGACDNSNSSKREPATGGRATATTAMATVVRESMRPPPAVAPVVTPAPLVSPRPSSTRRGNSLHAVEPPSRQQHGGGRGGGKPGVVKPPLKSGGCQEHSQPSCLATSLLSSSPPSSSTMRSKRVPVPPVTDDSNGGGLPTSTFLPNNSFYSPQQAVALLGSGGGGHLTPTLPPQQPAIGVSTTGGGALSSPDGVLFSSPFSDASFLPLNNNNQCSGGGGGVHKSPAALVHVSHGGGPSPLFTALCKELQDAINSSKSSCRDSSRSRAAAGDDKVSASGNGQEEWGVSMAVSNSPLRQQPPAVSREPSDSWDLGNNRSLPQPHQRPCPQAAPRSRPPLQQRQRQRSTEQPIAGGRDLASVTDAEHQGTHACNSSAGGGGGCPLPSPTIATTTPGIVADAQQVARKNKDFATFLLHHQQQQQHAAASAFSPPQQSLRAVLSPDGVGKQNRGPSGSSSGGGFVGSVANGGSGGALVGKGNERRTSTSLFPSAKHVTHNNSSQSNSTSGFSCTATPDISLVTSSVGAGTTSTPPALTATAAAPSTNHGHEALASSSEQRQQRGQFCTPPRSSLQSLAVSPPLSSTTSLARQTRSLPQQRRRHVAGATNGQNLSNRDVAMAPALSPAATAEAAMTLTGGSDDSPYTPTRQPLISQDSSVFSMAGEGSLSFVEHHPYSTATHRIDTRSNSSYDVAGFDVFVAANTGYSDGSFGEIRPHTDLAGAGVGVGGGRLLGHRIIPQKAVACTATAAASGATSLARGKKRFSLTPVPPTSCAGATDRKEARAIKADAGASSMPRCLPPPLPPSPRPAGRFTQPAALSSCGDKSSSSDNDDAEKDRDRGSGGMQQQWQHCRYMLYDKMVTGPMGGKPSSSGSGRDESDGSVVGGGAQSDSGDISESFLVSAVSTSPPPRRPTAPQTTHH